MLYIIFLLFIRRPLPPRSTLFPYTTLFRSILNKLEYPTVPLVLGLVLGDTAELALRQSLIISGGSPLISDWRKASSRSEEHTSELQSRRDLVCRLLLEKKKKDTKIIQKHIS